MDTIKGFEARAIDAAGWDDFGGDEYREGLDRLLSSLRSEARLNAIGEAGMEMQVVDLLRNRLEVERHYAHHPETDAVRIDAPLVGLGLPRTGSTALACLLGADPRVRSLCNWELMRPCAPIDRPDDRMVTAQASMDRRARLFPRMTAMLPSTATSPSECQLYMGYVFTSQMFQAFVHIPSYVAWLNMEADLVPTYRYVRRVLKILGWADPKEVWRLKNPSHSLFITAFDTVFPDARYVMNHRDVAEVVPSMADMYYELHTAYSDQVDLRAIGEETVASCQLSMKRMIAFRDAGNNDRFFDIAFDPFVRDPYPAIEALYDWLGEPLTAEARAGMEHWRTTQPRPERYERTAPAAFGLNDATLRRRFHFYTDRFAECFARVPSSGEPA